MSSNFDVSMVYCCHRVLNLVKFEIYRRKKVVTQGLLTDCIKACFNQSVIIEFFPSLHYAFIPCTKHLHDCLCFDWKWCNHFKKKFFTYQIENCRISKCRICYKQTLISIFGNSFRIFCWVVVMKIKFKNLLNLFSPHQILVVTIFVLQTNI